MALPLQPDLRPSPPWFRRALLLLGLAGVVVVLALITRPHPPPIRLLGNDSDPAPYAAAVAGRIRAAGATIDVVMYSVWLGDDGAVPSLLRDLAEAAARGVRVTICLDADDRDDTDRNAAAAAWFSGHGIRVVRDEGDLRTHAKTLVIDGRWVVVGSHNWTRSGIHRNRELSLLVDDPALAREVTAWLQRMPAWAISSGPATSPPRG
jgi:phosphatidylserine/phosphatidylglycerophosphate/cardiolipin synthase-like enzyme